MHQRSCSRTRTGVAGCRGKGAGNDGDAASRRAGGVVDRRPRNADAVYRTARKKASATMSTVSGVARDWPTNGALPRLAVIVPATVHVEPGTGATLRVTVQNLTEEADHIELSFHGPEWAWLAPRHIRVGPGSSAQVRLSAAPPRRAESAPSRW